MIGDIMNILFIEPFYSGSHKTWLDELSKYSTHNIDLLTMPGKFWKWRMYGSCVTMAEAFNAYTKPIDLIIVSDMLDLSTFIALVHQKLHQLDIMPKIGVYFHENQLAYPWKDGCEDKSNNRDVHYGMMNYTSALTADFILFNSQYNQRSFIEELTIILNKVPDFNHQTIDILKNKSKVLPIGIANYRSLGLTPKTSSTKNHTPLILWNHRLEHDKNPTDFLNILIDIKNQGYTFYLAFLGEMNKSALKEYGHLIDELEGNLIAKGFQSKEDYNYYLDTADILPVTSNHDFFGISVMEAINHGCYPLLPNRLTYPDLYHIDKHPEIFYNTSEELKEKLIDLLERTKDLDTNNYWYLCEEYEWNNMINRYDKLFAQIGL